MNVFMYIQSITVTSLYLHNLVYIPLQLFWFSQVLVVFSLKYIIELKL
jgi:hypothetical protein